MSIFAALGINQTVLPQFLVFCITFAILRHFVFEPYYVAHKKRTQKAVGEEDLAEQLVAEAHDLHFKYEASVRSANDQISSLFKALHLEGLAEQSRILSEARSNAEALLSKGLFDLHHDIQVVKSELEKDLPKVKQQIIQKLLAKEVEDDVSTI